MLTNSMRKEREAESEVKTQIEAEREIELQRERWTGRKRARDVEREKQMERQGWRERERKSEKERVWFHIFQIRIIIVDPFLHMALVSTYRISMNGAHCRSERKLQILPNMSLTYQVR